MKNWKKNIKSFTWIIPFLSFFIGYYLINYLLGSNHIKVPSVIGKSLNEASKILSDSGLSLRILLEKEDSDIPDGTIIDQNPEARNIKTNKPVYLTISRKVREIMVPDFKGKDINEIQKIINKLGLKSKVYFLESIEKENSCISQFPEQSQLIDKNQKLILYISSGNKKLVLLPNFKGYKLKEIIDFLNLYELKPTIIAAFGQTYSSAKDYKVIDQRPIAGSIVQLNKFLNIQLQVEEIIKSE